MAWLKGDTQVWWLLFLLLFTSSAWLCLQHSCNLGTNFQPSPVYYLPLPIADPQPIHGPPTATHGPPTAHPWPGHGLAIAQPPPTNGPLSAHSRTTCPIVHYNNCHWDCHGCWGLQPTCPQYDLKLSNPKFVLFLSTVWCKWENKSFQCLTSDCLPIYWWYLGNAEDTCKTNVRLKYLHWDKSLI